MLISYALTALVTISLFYYLSTIIIVVFKGYLTSKANEIFVDKIFKLIISTLLSINTINPTTIIFTEMGQINTLISCP